MCIFLLLREFIEIRADFVFTTQDRFPCIAEIHRERIEKYITGIVNNNKLCKEKFSWQPSCSAFSVSKGDIDKVCKYIFNQSEHHKTQTFAEEYDKFLKFYQHTLSGK